MKRFLTLLTVLLVLVTLGVPQAQASSLSYVGGAEKYLIAPGSKHSPTDLFSDFKDVMPGDTLTEQIVIKNAASRKVKIKLYMRSLGAQKNTEDFLSQLKLTVKQAGDSVLFAAPADETAQLTEWTYLGTIYSGGKITLDVTLEVPITLGNEFADEIGYVDWQFKVEELPVSPDDPQPPKTGDEMDLFLYGGLMVLSLAALTALLLAMKRRTAEN